MKPTSCWPVELPDELSQIFAYPILLPAYPYNPCLSCKDFILFILCNVFILFIL
jgi:hypothetical protein